MPFDSVFYDTNGDVLKIKRYASVFQANDKYQKGNFLFDALLKVKQFTYNSAGEIITAEHINFSDRWNITDAEKVTTIQRYKVSHQQNNYIITRTGDPKNDYSDGTFIYEFDDAHQLKSAAFTNYKQTEKWKTSIETNTLGYVTRYIYDVNGHISSTLLINYFPDAKGKNYTFETITCTFESDGISYFQKNNTTGKSRIRDKFTGEWGPWQ
jgi:hypothetical protein